MSVVCAACHTENRDAAMFCHGCARKLPAFAATAPSALETMRARDQQAGSGASAAQKASPLRDWLPAELRPFWIRLALLMLVAAIGFLGWFAYVTRKVPARQPQAVTAVAPPPPAAVAAPAKKPEPSPTPPEPVPLSASLSQGEAEVAPGPLPPVASASVPAAAPAPAPAPAPSPSQAERRQAPRISATSTRSTALDPRRGCETLSFIFAARCEAAHCDRAEYARHPRCDAVRADRRRDEARRNPTLGY